MLIRAIRGHTSSKIVAVTQNSSNFGLVIPLGHADYPYIKGLLASIRHFMGDVPVCVIVDGDFSVRTLIRRFGIQAIYREDIRNPALQQESFGIGRTSVTAIWEGPFEHYFKLDADMLVWGNLLDWLPECEPYDFVHTSPYEPWADDVVRKYFNPDHLEGKVRLFDWREKPYFNAGFYYIKRNAFDRDEYLELIRLRNRDRQAFVGGDQGVFNFMAHRAISEDRIKAAHRPFQTFVGLHSPEELTALHPMEVTGPRLEGKPRVIHYLGDNKPYWNRHEVYPAPMTWFRQRQGGARVPLAWLKYEDWKVQNTRAQRVLADVLPGLPKRFGQSSKVNHFFRPTYRYGY